MMSFESHMANVLTADIDNEDYQVATLNAALRERLRFIDFMLENVGVYKRRFSMDYFGLSQPQVTLDLRMYRHLAPDNLVHDLSARCYRPTPAFVRRFP